MFPFSYWKEKLPPAGLFNVTHAEAAAAAKILGILFNGLFDSPSLLKSFSQIISPCFVVF